MSKPFTISHSGRGKFVHCGELYRLHYLEKIRPTGTSSSLVFGSAIDSAAEIYLIERNKQHAINVFKQKCNNAKEQHHTEVEFHRNDFDHELLTESDNNSVIKDTIYETSSDLVEAGENQERITLAKWASLLQKGLLIINAFTKWVDENVEEVLEIQSLIELVDDAGNEITGKADFVIKMRGYDIPLLVDLKTAARYYERDSVKTSEQLALYYFYLKNTKYPEMKRAAYLVLSKQIKKNRTKTCQKCGAVTMGREQTCAAGGKGKNRCNGEFDVAIFPEATIQFIHDEIPQHFIDETIDKFSIVVSKIKKGEFEKNLEGCASYFGKPCPYFKYCHENCNMEGLVKKEEK